MDDALRNALVVEVRDFLAENEVFHERRTAQAAFSKFWLSATGTPWLVVSG